MRIHIVQHVPFEGPGAILDWAIRHHHEVHVISPAQGDHVPSPDDTDFLIVLGGPMSVHDESRYPWLREEKRAIKKFVEADQKPLLGICLGAQIIAEVLGAQITSNSEKEIGWFPIQFNKAGFFQNSSEYDVFHWHGEIFSLPQNAQPLAHSKITPVQGFSFGKKTLALQFHLELNGNALQDLIRECGSSVNVANTYEQSPEDMLRLAMEKMKKTEALLDFTLQRLTQSS